MRGRWDGGAVVLAGLWFALGTTHAQSQEPSQPHAPTPPPGTNASAEGTPAEDAEPSWAQGSPRWFVGSLLSAGGALEARAIAGYGRPHWTWVGLELGALTTQQVGMTFARLRAAFVLFDLAITWRGTWSYARGTPAEQARYRDVDLDVDPRARYGSIDLWAWGYLPVPLGLLDWELETVYVYAGVDPGRALYEEYLRAVTHNRWLVSTRAGYELMWADGRGLVGPLLELTWIADRGNLWRVGPDFWWSFSKAWSFGARLTFAISSPDDLGVYNGMSGTLRVRHAWASGR